MRVPPGTRVKAIITSFKVKYEQQYIIKFGINSWISVPVKYRRGASRFVVGQTLVLSALPR